MRPHVPSAREAIAQRRGEPVRILLCDDHQLLVEALSTVLRRRGDEVVATVSPEQAVMVAADQQPDVCVMDRSFPDGQDGIAAIPAMRAVSPATDIMLLTGNADAAGARAAVQAGARGFLRKDEPLQVILAAIDTTAAGALIVIDASILRPPAPRREPPLAAPLTSREQDVLERLVRGESTQAMARSMQISYSTARTHSQNLLAKLGVHSQLEAAAFATRRGLVRDVPDRSSSGYSSGA